MVLKYEELTEEQILYCFNGVGSDHFPIDPHDLIFKEPAKKHDVLYWIGGTEQDRLFADETFYKESLDKVSEHLGPMRWFYRCAAEIYCFFLFKLGRYAFEYGKKPDSWEQLKKRVDIERQKLISVRRKWRKYGGIVLGLCWVGVPTLVCYLIS